MSEMRRGTDQEPVNNTNKLVSRRSFLKGVAIAGAVTTAELGLGNGTIERISKPERRTREQVIDAGELAGKPCDHELFRLYFGLEGKTIPEKFKVNFVFQLAQLDAAKNKWAKNNPVIKELGERHVEEYSKYESAPSSIEEFIAEAGSNEITKQIDWEALGEGQGLGESDTLLVRRLAEAVSGQDLMALSITELMPSKNAETNVQAMELLLQHAGKEFVYRIPAIYDTQLSFGPYQFTPYALGERRGQKVGASVINPYVREDARVTEDLRTLSGVEHHKVAILNLVEDFCLLVKSLRVEPRDAAELLQKLETMLESSPKQIAVIAGAAHHAPTHAVEAIKTWFRQNMKKSYAECCANEDLGKYAARMQRSVEALDDYLTQKHL